MINHRTYTYELSMVLVALDYEDVNEKNALQVAKYMTYEMLSAVVNDTIKHMHAFNGYGNKSVGTIIGWCPWWVKACQREIENRIDSVLLT